MIMQVRLGSVGGITALAQQLPAFHFVADLDDDRSLFEMRQHRDFFVAMLDDNAVTDGGIRIHRTWRVVTNAFNHFYDRAVRRRKQFATERVVILVVGTVAPLRLSILAHS